MKWECDAWMKLANEIPATMILPLTLAGFHLQLRREADSNTGNYCNICTYPCNQSDTN